jgi:hypothetical protein
MTPDEVREKFVRYAEPCVNRERATAFANEVLSTQPAASVSRLWQALGGR